MKSSFVDGIQSCHKYLTERQRFFWIKAAAIHIQSVARAWLSANKLQDSFALFVIQERMIEFKGHLQEASKLFSEMLKKGISPNTVTFNTMMML